MKNYSCKKSFTSEDGTKYYKGEHINFFEWDKLPEEDQGRFKLIIQADQDILIDEGIDLDFINTDFLSNY